MMIFPMKQALWKKVQDDENYQIGFIEVENTAKNWIKSSQDYINHSIVWNRSINKDTGQLTMIKYEINDYKSKYIGYDGDRCVFEVIPSANNQVNIHAIDIKTSQHSYKLRDKFVLLNHEKLKKKRLMF